MILNLFSQAAAMAGFIKHVVWVWPEWDHINHNASKSSGTIQIGWTIVQQSSLGAEKDFCMCITDETGQKCMFFSEDETNPEVEMENDLCFVKRSIGFTEIREDLAVEYLNSIHKNVDIILDIDEDFFGCEYASQPLFDHAVPNIEVLDSFLNQLCCPMNPPAEKVLDNFLTDLIEFIKLNNCRFEKHRECRNNLWNKIKQFYLNKSSLLRSHLCSDALKNTTLLFDLIIKEFLELNKFQLSAIQTVGFCLSTTHKTYQLLNPSLFGLCKGANSPNETVVTEHRTNRKEVHTRGELINNILGVFRRNPPKFVTVCRSIRDGYTPRKYFKDIEYLVLKAIRSNYPDTRVFYDDGLLNGKTGFRHS